MTDVHPEARRRFEELGAELVRSIIRLREPVTPPPMKPRFEPDVVKRPPVTDKDIIGDVVLGYAGRDGQSIGKMIVRKDGERVGFMGPGYERLVALGNAMARTQPFGSLASQDFLTEQIFAWATGAPATPDRGGGSLVDFVLNALKTTATEVEVIIPISDVHIESELDLAGCRVKTFPKSFFDQLESSTIADEAHAVAHRAWCAELRSDLQGLAAAYVLVTAEPKRAEQLATARADVAIGILRFFAPAHFDARTVSRIDRWGYAPQRAGAVFFGDNGGRLQRMTNGLVDSAGTMVLDDRTLGYLRGAGLTEIQRVVAKANRSQFEDALVSGILLFGRAALTTDMRQRLVWYCAALESMLLRSHTEGVTQNLAERLAFGAYGTLAERRQAITDVKAAYDVRSRFIHHGVEVDESEPVLKLAHHGLRLFLELAKSVDRFPTKDAFVDHVESMKLS
jgi:hypothetical protein